jgi:hypothetical protein
MKYLLISFLCLLAGLDEGKLVKTKITKDVTVSLPQTFRAMTDDEIADKYLTAKRPTAMYTNPERIADFGFNQTETRWRKVDMPMLKGVYKGSIAGLHGKVNFVQDTIATINDREFIVFEFVSEVTDVDAEGKPRSIPTSNTPWKAARSWSSTSPVPPNSNPSGKPPPGPSWAASASRVRR